MLQNELRNFIRLRAVWILKFMEFHIVTSSNYNIWKVFDCLRIWFWISWIATLSQPDWVFFHEVIMHMQFVV